LLSEATDLAPVCPTVVVEALLARAGAGEHANASPLMDLPRTTAHQLPVSCRQREWVSHIHHALCVSVARTLTHSVNTSGGPAEAGYAATVLGAFGIGLTRTIAAPIPLLALPPRAVTVVIAGTLAAVVRSLALLDRPVALAWQAHGVALVAAPLPGPRHGLPLLPAVPGTPAGSVLGAVGHALAHSHIVVDVSDLTVVARLQDTVVDPVRVVRAAQSRGAILAHAVRREPAAVAALVAAGAERPVIRAVSVLDALDTLVLPAAMPLPRVGFLVQHPPAVVRHEALDAPPFDAVADVPPERWLGRVAVGILAALQAGAANTAWVAAVRTVGVVSTRPSKAAHGELQHLRVPRGPRTAERLDLHPVLSGGQVDMGRRPGDELPPEQVVRALGILGPDLRPEVNDARTKPLGPDLDFQRPSHGPAEGQLHASARGEAVDRGAIARLCDGEVHRRSGNGPLEPVVERLGLDDRLCRGHDDVLQQLLVVRIRRAVTGRERRAADGDGRQDLGAPPRCDTDCMVR